MIKQIRGSLVSVSPEAAIIEAGGLGYEVTVPKTTAERLAGLEPGAEVALHTYHYLAMDHSRGTPMLLGFDAPAQLALFQRLLDVPRVGPRMACRMLAAPVAQIAVAIELGDVKFLKSLPGIGASKARDISNALRGKVADFASLDEDLPKGVQTAASMRRDAADILVQLGHSVSDARDLIHETLTRRPDITTVDELVTEALAERV